MNFLVFFVVFFGLFSGTSLEIVWGFMVGFWFGIFWPISVIQNFLVIFKGIFHEYFGNFWEFFWNFLGIVWKSFGNSLRILNCILTKSCKWNIKWCNFWLNDRQGQQIKSLEAPMQDYTSKCLFYIKDHFWSRKLIFKTQNVPIWGCWQFTKCSNFLEAH